MTRRETFASFCPDKDGSSLERFLWTRYCNDWHRVESPMGSVFFTYIRPPDLLPQTQQQIQSALSNFRWKCLNTGPL